jgi:hypothetical protein
MSCLVVDELQSLNILFNIYLNRNNNKRHYIHISIEYDYIALPDAVVCS